MIPISDAAAGSATPYGPKAAHDNRFCSMGILCSQPLLNAGDSKPGHRGCLCRWQKCCGSVTSAAALPGQGAGYFVCLLHVGAIGLGMMSHDSLRSCQSHGSGPDEYGCEN